MFLAASNDVNAWDIGNISKTPEEALVIMSSHIYIIIYHYREKHGNCFIELVMMINMLMLMFWWIFVLKKFLPLISPSDDGNDGYDEDYV